MIRNLKDYQWEGNLEKRRIRAYSKKTKEVFDFNKVAFLSFTRFVISFLDSLRVKQIKEERERAEKLRKQIKELKAQIKSLKEEIKLKKNNRDK